MTHFDRRHLRYFIAVAEELHFSHAAQRLHISQPPLSQQIADLEADLGVPLLVRSKRKVEITAAGQQFLVDARAILADMDKAAVRARAAAAGQTGVLRVGLSYSSPMSPILSAIFRRFGRDFPQVALELHENTSAKQLDGLYHRTLDVCFIWSTRDDPSPDLTILALGQHEFKMVAARELPLGKKPAFTAHDLRGHTIFLTLRQTRMHFYEALMSACRKAEFEPDIRADVIQWPFIMNIAAARQGIAFIPDFFSRIRPAGTVFRTCSFLPASARKMPLSVAYKTHNLAPAVKNFIGIAQEIAARS